MSCTDVHGPVFCVLFAVAFSAAAASPGGPWTLVGKSPTGADGDEYEIPVDDIDVGELQVARFRFSFPRLFSVCTLGAFFGLPVQLLGGSLVCNKFNFLCADFCSSSSLHS